MDSYFNSLYNKLGKIWCLNEDDKMVLELLSSIYLSKTQRIEKIFAILVAPSGCGKSTQFKLFDDEKETTYFIDKFTKSSLSSGMIKRNKITGEEYDPSLAPKLKGKVIFISDMAKMTSSRDKDILWSEMIGLYDGTIKEVYGNGKSNDYNNLNVTMICGATPMIYSQMLLSQQLGTRFLFFNRGGRDQTSVLEKAEQSFFIDKEGIFGEIKREFQGYLKSRVYQQDRIISPEAKAKLMRWAKTSANLRSSAKIDITNGQLIEPIIVEEPTRLYKQFLVIFKGLLSLTDDYTEERALRIIGRLAISNCNPNRIEVLKCLIRYHILHSDGFSRRDISNYLRISDKTCLGELNALYNLGITSRIERVVDKDRELVHFKFKVNQDHEIALHLAEYYDLMDCLDILEKPEVIKYG